MTSVVDAKALRYFVAVAQHCGYSRAASALRITQPAVSRQIQALERGFGTKLFRREGRLFVLTDAGEKLMLHAQKIVLQIDQLHDVVGAAAHKPAGRLSIGMPWAIGEHVLPELLQRYRKRYPAVFLHVAQGYSDTLANSLAAGSLDLAVLYEHPRASELTLMPLAELHLGLVLPAATKWKANGPKSPHCASLKEALEHPLIMPSRGHVLRDLVDRTANEHQRIPVITMEVDSLPLLRSLVVNGQGATMLALSAVQKEVETGDVRFFPVRSPSMPWSMSMAWRQSKPETPALRAMKQELTLVVERVLAR